MKREFEESVQNLYEKITKNLIRTGRSITAMESCTGGFLASLLTDTEGASAVFHGAFVTYSNEAKVMAGVPRDVIDTYSVYSMETAAAMAKAARQHFGTDISVGITGSFGNTDPANPESSVPGEIFFAIETKDGVQRYRAELPLNECRHESKLRAALLVGERLFSYVEETVQGEEKQPERGGEDV